MDWSRLVPTWIDVTPMPGNLVIFDRDENRSWDEKIFRREDLAGENSVTIWGM